MTDNDSGYTPIDCNLYDYIEIACLYRYPVRIATASGEILTGKAVTTSIERAPAGDKVEHLNLEIDGALRKVRLDTIRVLEPLGDNARFGKVRFTD